MAAGRDVAARSGVALLDVSRREQQLVDDRDDALCVAAALVRPGARADVRDRVDDVVVAVVAERAMRALRRGRGRDAQGVVAVIDQLLFAARNVQKGDARRRLVATGGHGGVLGSVANGGEVVISWRPVRRSTWRSAVRLSQLPEAVDAAVRGADGRLTTRRVATRTADGDLDPAGMPAVEIVKQGQYGERDEATDPQRMAGLLAAVERVPDVGHPRRDRRRRGIAVRSDERVDGGRAPDRDVFRTARASRPAAAMRTALPSIATTRWRSPPAT